MSQSLPTTVQEALQMAAKEAYSAFDDSLKMKNGDVAIDSHHAPAFVHLHLAVMIAKKKGATDSDLFRAAAAAWSAYDGSASSGDTVYVPPELQEPLEALGEAARRNPRWPRIALPRQNPGWPRISLPRGFLRRNPGAVADYHRLFTEKEVEVANATCRASVGRSLPITPRIVAGIAAKADKILDFGAGTYATYTLELRKAGLDVTAHDFGDNWVKGLHDADALTRKYDIVFASNVLNVQSTVPMMENTLAIIATVLKPGGVFIANYPDKPRKLGWSPAQVRAALEKQFGKVDELDRKARLGYAYQVFACHQ
jgi:SAM-dependent methyltransferase